MTNESAKTSVDDAHAHMRRLTRRSFAVGAVGAVTGLGGLAWLGTRDTEDGLSWPLRRVLEFNERVGSGLFSDSHLAPTFDPTLAKEPKVNGHFGLATEIDLDRWRLQVQMPDGKMAHQLPLSAILALPRVEMVTELKCVEGWSQMVHWAGVRLADFVAKYGSRTAYVGLVTPDRGYFVGLDFASAMHPQTLLCHEMNGQPLNLDHGAPLRLVATVKYGYKSIRRIGSISFSNERPADFWAAQGYDYYAGL